MKINIDSKLQSSSVESTTITITFDPQIPSEENLAAMVMAVCDTVRQLTFLQEVVQEADK